MLVAPRFVAEQIAREAFHNVAFFAGSFRELQAAIAVSRVDQTR